jgi:hypothetical protein
MLLINPTTLLVTVAHTVNLITISSQDVKEALF